MPKSEQTAAGCYLSVIVRREDFSKGYSSEAGVHKHCLMEAHSLCYDRYTLETGVCARCVFGNVCLHRHLASISVLAFKYENELS